MSLLSRLREKQISKVATATVATLATVRPFSPSCVAKVARVAVANPLRGQTVLPAKVGDGGTATAPAANEDIPRLAAVDPMTENEHSLILEWLSHIGEHDPVSIAEVVTACQTRLLDRDYFLRRAWTDLPQPDVETDDRIRCRQCNNLHGAQCDAVPIGTLPRITKQFKPDPTVLRRCAWFETIPIPDWDINQPSTKESS